MNYKRRMATSWEQAAIRYLDSEYINVILPSDLGAVIGCSAVRAGVLLRSIGWYPQRSRQQKNTIYHRRNPNKESKNMKTLDELIDSSWGPPRARVVCICGSVRFKKEIMLWACYWSSLNYVIVMPHCFAHEKFHDTKNRSAVNTKRQLDILHFTKIEMSEFVFVVDVEGYVGESTSREIRFARRLGKPVKYASKTLASTPLVEERLKEWGNAS